MSEDRLWAGPPEVRDVDEYAAGLGIGTEEAERRNALVESFLASEAAEWLDQRRQLYWIEESTDNWGVVIGRRQSGNRFAKNLEKRLAGTGFEQLVEIRQVRNGAQDLESIEERMMTEIERWCLAPATSFEIDYVRNRLVAGTQSVSDFSAAVEEAGLAFREDQVVIVEHRVPDPPLANMEPCEAPLRELEAARERWAAHDLDRYAYRVAAGSAWFARRDVAEVSVWDGTVSEVVPLELTPDDPFYPPRFGTQYGAVEQLFDMIESYPVQWLTVAYDPDHGYPISVSYDHPTIVDEEWSERFEFLGTLDTPPAPPQPRLPRNGDWSLEIERFPWGVVVVDAIVGPPDGLSQSEQGWRHTLDVTDVVYRAPGAEPIDVGSVGVVDRMAPRALLHRGGENARLILTTRVSGEWSVVAVLESTPDGLRFEGPIARRGFSDEIAYLCHYPRRDIPTDPPPERDAEAELDLLMRWLDERGVRKQDADATEVSKEALRRVCEEA